MSADNCGAVRAHGAGLGQWQQRATVGGRCGGDRDTYLHEILPQGATTKCHWATGGQERSQARPLAVTRAAVNCYCGPPGHTAHANRGEQRKCKSPEPWLLGGSAGTPKVADQVDDDSQLQQDRSKGFQGWNAKIPT